MIKETMFAVTAFAVFSTAAAASTTSVPVAYGVDSSILQNQCNALASARAGDWSAEAVEGDATYVSGPTEIGLRDIDLSSVVGTGPFTWGGITIVGDPFRNGGSVNMFGNQRATEQNFTSSTYSYRADFTSTFSYASICNLTETIYIPPVHTPATPLQGFYTNPGAGDCRGFTPDKHFWGQDQGACVFNKTGGGDDAIDIPEEYRFNYDTQAGAPVRLPQTDNFPGREVNGGPVTLVGDLFVGNPVVCISPSTSAKKGVPGEWVKKDVYDGDKCTTVWFNDPTIGRNGSTTSQGNYISVPAF